MTGPNNGKDKYFLEALGNKVASIRTSWIGIDIGALMARVLIPLSNVDLKKN